MNTLSKEKLNNYKNKKKLTNCKISELTNIPISNIDKIFSGTNKNPTLETIQKIASVLDCTIDDFIDYKEHPLSPIYLDKKTEEIAKILFANEELRELFEVVSCLNKKDIELLLMLAQRLQKG